MKTFVGVVLEQRHGVVAAFDEQVDRLCSEERRVKPIEENRAPAALRVADLSGEDRFARRTSTAIQLKVAVAEQMDHLVAQRFSSAAQDDVAGRVCRGGFGAEL